MNQMYERITRSVSTSAMIILALLPLYVVSPAEMSEVSKVVFYVGWYDIGKSALEGLKGIKRVEKGFRNLKEINTVYYDPILITIEEMEGALKLKVPASVDISFGKNWDEAH